MKKSELFLWEFTNEQKSNILIILIMTMMLFLITQSIGYFRYLNYRNSIYDNVDSEKSYWFNMTPEKAREMNVNFTDINNDKEFLEKMEYEILFYPHISDVSFIGRYWVKKEGASETCKIYTYDKSMKEIIGSLVMTGRNIDFEKQNEILINKELSETYGVGDEIYINMEHEIVDYSYKNAMKLTIKGIIDSKFLPNLQKNEGDVIVTSSVLFDEYDIEWSFLYEAFVETDTKIDMAEEYNGMNPELGFFMSFVDFYSSDKNGEFAALNIQFVKQMCILIMCIISIGSLNFVRLYNKKYEYGVYYLCGSTINDIVIISTSRNLFISLLSSITGFVITVSLSNINEIADRIFDYKTFGSVLIVSILIYLISSIPIYLELKNQNPIRLIKDVR